LSWSTFGSVIDAQSEYEYRLAPEHGYEHEYEHEYEYEYEYEYEFKYA